MKHLSREEAKWLQSSINVVLAGSDAPGNSRLRLDGIVGSKTEEAFYALPNPNRVAISRAAEVMGVALEKTTPVEKPAAAPILEEGWIAESDLHGPAFTASVAADVPFAFIMRLVHLEAIQRVRNGKVEYNLFSTRGEHRGLTQMGPKAWIDANEWLISKGRAPLPPYATGAFEVGPSLLAAAAYNARYAPSLYKGLNLREPTFAMRYTLHNQGPNWLARARSGAGAINFGGQSSKARQLITEAARDLGVMYA